MPIISKNPFTNTIRREFDGLNSVQLDEKLMRAKETFSLWKSVPMNEKKSMILNLAKILRTKKDTLGMLATEEMGKVISQSVAEVEKCAWVCEHYAEQAERYLEEIIVENDDATSWVRFDPLGAILGVMPWNFPFWQVFRFAVPTVMAGNVVLLKHASNVPECAEAIETLFEEAGFPIGVFQTLLIRSSEVEKVLMHTIVQGVALTGSELAGSQVAGIAGREIKRSVLELGGSDPFIVLPDAELRQTCTAATTSRMISAGQCCISAKRFIVNRTVEEKFTTWLKEAFGSMIVGDPRKKETAIGPLANEQIMNDIEQQVIDSVKEGAELILGGQKHPSINSIYLPTILREVKPGMRVFDEETFGPVATITTVDSESEAIKMANQSRYGLGASIWTKDLQLARDMARQLEVGAVFINDIVKSDPRLPFGGIKKSGYGRELGSWGIREFVNVKSVWIK